MKEIIFKNEKFDLMLTNCTLLLPDLFIEVGNDLCYFAGN